MSRQSTDEQLRFLLSCCRFSNNGKIDFTEVAKECGIVTKGAAAKRYERLMKANDINPNGGPLITSPTTTPTTPTKKPKKDVKATGVGSTAKKRKLDETGPGNSSADDNDGGALNIDQTPTPTLKNRRAPRTASVFNKLNLNQNTEEDEPKGGDKALDNDNAIGGMFDGTTEVVDADPNWGYVFTRRESNGGRHTPAPESMADFSGPFYAFVHADHPLVGPSSGLESSLFPNTEINTAVDDQNDDANAINTEGASIFIDD